MRPTIDTVLLEALMSSEDKPKIFQIIAPGQRETHLFEAGETPKTLFLCLSERSVSEDGAPEAHARIKIFIDTDTFKGQPYEDDIRTLIGLPPRNKERA
jgi:hypothetical protein